ncbi:hypothetical protein Dimus_035764, partial [Dionaea muscipula]
FSGGGLAPPASPRRRPSLLGDVLTQPRGHRSLVEECCRHLHVAHPRLMWSYDSTRNQDLRVRSVVERSMIEGLGSVEEELWSHMADFAIVVPPSEGLAPIGTVDPDLQSSSEDFLLTMADPLTDHGGGCKEALGPSLVSNVLSGGVGSELMVSVNDGEPEKRVDDELQERSVGPLPSPCSPVNAPSPSRFVDSDDRGCGATERAVGADVGLSSPCLSGLNSTAMRYTDTEVAGDADAEGNSECPTTLSSMFCAPLLSLSQEASILVCAGEQGIGMVGEVVEQPVAVELGVGGECGCLGFADADCRVLPVTAVSFSLSSAPLMVIAECSGSGGLVSEEVEGMVREEGRVPPAAKEALRSQPTDGLRQLPRPPVGPLPVRVGEAVVGGGLPPGGGGMVPVGREGGDVGGVQSDGGGVQSSRSFAHVVRPDRRADVELSYSPPADGGNSITMAESDGDAEGWGSCLVGYFLHKTLPFGYVRSTVSRLWMKSRLTEVKSFDDGFFVFRFADSLSRDAVIEEGPWFVGGKPLLLRKWECLLSLTKETLSRILV